MWYWLFKYILLGPLLSLLGRPKVEGLEHVPSSGPVILASNHLAVMDSYLREHLAPDVNVWRQLAVGMKALATSAIGNRCTRLPAITAPPR